MRFALFLTLSLLFVASPANADTILLQTDSNSERIDLVSQIDGQTVERSGNYAVVEVLDAEKALDQIGDKAVAEPNRIVRSFTNDTFWDHQWSLSNAGGFKITSPLELNPLFATPGADIKAVPAWSLTKGQGVVVAVVDSGVRTNHPDLQGQFAPGGKDWIDHDFDPNSTYDSHGTHVSGIIAGVQDNNQGISGVAPQAKLLELRTLDSNGAGDLADVVSAFYYAKTQNARIVNASLGMEGSSQVVNQAIADNPNVLFVFAAGNGDNQGLGINTDVRPFSPCNAPGDNVICVGATNYNDVPTLWSNFGQQTVDLFAPGDKIYSAVTQAQFGKDYQFMSGTSMAAPEVSGVAALILSKYPTLTPVQVKQAILESVDRSTVLSALSLTGGRLNAEKALQRASEIIAPGSAPLQTLPETTSPPSQSAPTPPVMTQPTTPAVEPSPEFKPTLDVTYKIKKSKKTKALTVKYKTTNIQKLILVIETKVCKTKCVWKPKKYTLDISKSKREIKKLTGKKRFYLIAWSNGQATNSQTVKI